LLKILHGKSGDQFAIQSSLEKKDCEKTLERSKRTCGKNVETKSDEKKVILVLS